MSERAVGPHRLDRELGSGGMGKVYAAVVEGRAAGLDFGVRVAVKVVHAHLLGTPEFLKRILREAEVAKAVVHENVLWTFECDSLRGRRCRRCSPSSTGMASASRGGGGGCAVDPP